MESSEVSAVPCFVQLVADEHDGLQSSCPASAVSGWRLSCEVEMETKENQSQIWSVAHRQSR
jgi:hypothetical protein